MTVEIEGSYRTPAFEHAKVADAMHRASSPATATLHSASSLRSWPRRHIHSVVVTDLATEGPGWGVVTDIDILGVAEDGVEGITAGQVAGTELPTIAAEESLSRAAQLMNEHAVSHLVVVDDGRAVGVLSSLDVAGRLAWGRA